MIKEIEITNFNCIPFKVVTSFYSKKSTQIQFWFNCFEFYTTENLTLKSVFKNFYN